MIPADRQIAFRDLGFAEVLVRSYSARGVPFDRKLAIGMPKLSPETLDLACYLYRDEKSARAGEEFGGTGFLVAMRSEVHPNVTHMYAVTNWHVACRDGFSVVRLNTRKGETDTFAFGPEDWEFDPRYDIAAVPIPVKHDVHQAVFIGTDRFITKEKIEGWEFGPGEDVFMVGRFVDHDGGLVNRPAVRFGNISVMPTPIEQPNGRMADSYCIDLNSRTGYSGSPVFLYRTPGYDLTDVVKEGDGNLLLAGVNFLGFLGIHFAQFPEFWEFADGPKKKAAKESGEPLLLGGKYVKGLSGMTCVLPAWNILEVLNMPNLKARRDRDNQVFTAHYAKQGAAPVAEAASEPKDANPQGREDFTRLLNAAVRKPRQGGQT